MKKMLVATAVALLFGANTFAQKVYTEAELSAPKTPKTEQELIGKGVKTADLAEYKAVKYPVYNSPKGKLYFVYKNSNGNWSKKYIPTTTTAVK